MFVLQQQQQWQHPPMTLHNTPPHPAPSHSLPPPDCTNQQNTDAALVKVVLEPVKINIIDLNNKYPYRIRRMTYSMT